MPGRFFNRQTHRRMQDLLMAHADALIAGTLNREALFEQYDDLVASQVESLMVLAEVINRSLKEVSPSEQFVARLALQLRNAGTPASTPWWDVRVRQLSPRTQIAAGIGIGGVATLTAGVVLLASRRPLMDLLDAWRNRHTATA